MDNIKTRSFPFQFPREINNEEVGKDKKQRNKEPAESSCPEGDSVNIGARNIELSKG